MEWRQRLYGSRDSELEELGGSKLHNSLGLLRETLDFLIVHYWESEQILLKRFRTT